MRAEPPDTNSNYIFSGSSFRSSLEQLQKISDKKIATFVELGEEDKAELYRRASHLARERLAKLLHAEV